MFLGAESTGKSTLTARMADELGTVHVAEFGREHYERRGGRLTLDDYVDIAVEHRRLEDEAILRANRYLFVDTNAVTTMFFSHYYDRDSLPELRRLADECRDALPPPHRLRRRHPVRAGRLAGQRRLAGAHAGHGAPRPRRAAASRTTS